MKREIFVYLRGGLGNQMFQYAAARAIAEENNAEVVVDTWSGFVRDKIYRNIYKLSPFPIAARAATAIERIPIWLYRIASRLSKKSESVNQYIVGNRFVVETDSKYLSEILNSPISKKIWLVGYLQSPKYFAKYSDIIARELAPPVPTEEIFLKLAHKIQGSDACALGVRLYEEAPGGSTSDAGAKSVSEINSAIRSMLELNSNLTFYVFCTHRSSILDKLDLPETTEFILPSEGYAGALENLWLLSQFKHHLFTFSTFYWWGAWLSEQKFKDANQLIFAADNFANKDSLCSHWQKF